MGSHKLGARVLTTKAFMIALLSRQNQFLFLIWRKNISYNLCFKSKKQNGGASTVPLDQPS